MSFEQILQSKYKYLIEAIEHGSSDVQIIQYYKDELYKKTGYKYID